MAVLKHEVWIDAEGLPGVCLAGPHGDGFRRMNGPGASLVWTFEAGSHFEAMTIYCAHMGWGEYTSDQPWDREPYPEEWLAVQRGSEV